MSYEELTEEEYAEAFNNAVENTNMVNNARQINTGMFKGVAAIQINADNNHYDYVRIVIHVGHFVLVYFPALVFLK